MGKMRIPQRYKWPVVGVLIAGVLALLLYSFAGGESDIRSYLLFAFLVAITLILFVILAMSEGRDTDSDG